MVMQSARCEAGQNWNKELSFYTEIQEINQNLQTTDDIDSKQQHSDTLGLRSFFI